MHQAGANFVYLHSTNVRLELHNPVDYYNNNKSRAVARKPHDVATVLFGLKFADIHYKFKNSSFESQALELQKCRHKIEFNAKQLFKVIQGYVSWSTVSGKAIKN